MICDADITSKVGDALGLAGPPPTEWRWSDGVYTCDYQLPMGRMSLQVRVLADVDQARTAFDADRARTPEARPLAGLGEQAFGTGNGTVLVLKDGELVEQGRYEELVRKGGLFAELDAQGKFVADADDGMTTYAEPTLTTA
jgi:hypothetical protein